MRQKKKIQLFYPGIEWETDPMSTWNLPKRIP